MSEAVARKIFGISEFQDLSLDVLKKIYRTLSKKHHPDLVGNSKYHLEKMQEINSAYELLKKLATSSDMGSRHYSYINVDEYRNTMENSLTSTMQVEYETILNVSKNSEYVDLIMHFADLEYYLREDVLKNLKKMNAVRIIDSELSRLNRSVRQNAREFFGRFIEIFYKEVEQELSNDEYYLDYLGNYIDEVLNKFNCSTIYESVKYSMEVKRNFSIRIINIKVDDLIDEVMDTCIPGSIKNIFKNKRNYFISKAIDILSRNYYEIVSDFKVRTTILKVLSEDYKHNFANYHKRGAKIKKLKNRSIIYDIDLDSEISYLESLEGEEFEKYYMTLEEYLNNQINNKKR